MSPSPPLSMYIHSTQLGHILEDSAMISLKFSDLFIKKLPGIAPPHYILPRGGEAE